MINGSQIPMNPQVVLTILSGSRTGTTQIFDRPGTYSIGREEHCSMVFADDNDEHHNISRHHCDLQITMIDPPDVMVIDRNSTHGTFYHNQRIQQPTAVKNQDVINIGDVAIKITFLGSNPAPPPNPKTISVATPPIAKRNFLQPGKKLGVKIGSKFLQEIKNFLEISPPVLPATPENLAPALPLQFQDYELGELLGQGTFSEVYKAIHKQTGRSVALKILQPEVANQDDIIQKFIREIDNTKVLDHPHIVRLLDFRYHQGSFFYTTEYCEAGSLYGLMAQLGGKLPLDLAKMVMHQLLAGLAYTHQVTVPFVRLPDGGFGKGQGLVHRSLKPENILLTNDRGKLIVKISDFALATSFGAAGLTKSVGSFAGTPAYMSRHQLLHYESAQASLDLWAAVACLYEMLTGLPPRDFNSPDFTQVIMENPVIPILERSPWLSPALANVIDRALREAPDHSTHYQTALELHQDLLTVW
jgi:eukaryotic-like serine/threonine-protein kinase